ncbi:hypothetical protein GGS23DRAFT_478000 [Durotheca rogersii]|uniref:uncharacterized protein n=1 Tax=Durotheca rogersii TaxID=419775 RepID=UPI0022212587|nr:uncharacterized protein GGS23DRAFT_478000 [Durotheca rogersii]KAI5863999.1 hypothetical protein GGS23DRAFT_478000 [Durotheca rogersii]
MTISASTYYDKNGVATLTQTILVPLALPTMTSTFIVAPPAPTIGRQSKQTVHVATIPDGTYFLGLMLPACVAVAVSVLARVLHQTAKLYHPFHALASSTRGALAPDTVCFQTAGAWWVPAADVRRLLRGRGVPLLPLTGLLVLLAAVLVPLSSDTVGIVLEGPECAPADQGRDALRCEMVLAVRSVAAQLVVAVLVSMAALVGAAALVLRKWPTGLAASPNPWSMLHVAGLAANNDMRLLLRRLRNKAGRGRRISNREVATALADIPFVLDYWKDNGVLKYSILVINEEAQSLGRSGGRPATYGAAVVARGANAAPFFVLTWAGRVLFLGLLCAVLIGLMVYNIVGEGVGYIEFMMGRWRILRVSCTAGTTSGDGAPANERRTAVAFISPYRLLRRSGLFKGNIIHMTPPTNPFSGIRSSLAPGQRDIYAGIVAATAVLSEILPVLLSTALDKCTESFVAHEVCSWMAVGVLSIMILAVAGSFFVVWPHMPIDPSTLAGAMYYVTDPTTVSVLSMSPSSGLLFGRASPGTVSGV